jgi:hypothetical protein
VSADDAERVRAALEVAQETGDPDDRRDRLVEALDAALDLRDEGIRGAESLFSTIAEAGNLSANEAGHFISRALDELDAVEAALESAERGKPGRVSLPSTAERESAEGARETLEAVKGAATTDEREDHLIAAMRATARLADEREIPPSNVQEKIEAAVHAPDEEVPYFVNEAIRDLESYQERVAGLGAEEEATQDTVWNVKRRQLDRETLLTIIEARDRLESIPRAAIDEDTESRLITATEALDDAILEADLAAALRCMESCDE